jgi:hypothetical protein
MYNQCHLKCLKCFVHGKPLLNKAVFAENHPPIAENDEEIIVEPEIIDDENPVPRVCHHRHLSTDAKQIIKNVQLYFKITSQPP